MNARTAPQSLLVVDAVSEHHAVYRTQLEDITEHIEIVRPGEEAERLARQHPFAAVLVHVESNEGENNGEDIAPLVRSVSTVHPPVPVIVVAADIAAVQAVASIVSGPLDYVPTPIDPALLRAKLKVFLELARVRDELSGAREELRGLAAEVEEERGRAEALGRLVGDQIHRGKNLLAIIQSITFRTVSDGRNIGEARDALMGRLKALARVYEFMTAPRAEGVDLDDVVGAGLGDVAERVTVSGPPVRIAGSFAQTFALAVHELATNAVRHGALHSPEGTVTFGWTVVEQGTEQCIDVAWNEQGGASPSGAKPRFGFGLTLVSALARSAARPVDISFDGEGFVCRLRLPPDVIVSAAG